MSCDSRRVFIGLVDETMLSMMNDKRFEIKIGRLLVLLGKQLAAIKINNIYIDIITW